ncbi:uncharacterized protein, partial [Halyomorpha halys]|uniref:uncharacterized protein n=1 Tax=Halyomorpha halys TaxID=286706 RepID=UPI0034D1A275
YPQNEHPTHKYIFKPKYSNFFRNKINSTLPLAERTHTAIEFFKEIPLYIPEVINPPWIHRLPNTMLQLSRFPKGSTSPTEYRTRFSRLCQNIPDPFFIYTDGSKSDESTASSFITNNSTHKIKLHKFRSVYTAELHAIGSALHFSMTPGHVGITGNELADIAAKQALALPGQGTAILTLQEISLQKINEILSSWQAIWDECPPRVVVFIIFAKDKLISSCSDKVYSLLLLQR